MKLPNPIVRNVKAKLIGSLTDYINDTKSKVDVTESNNSAKSVSTKEGNPESKSSGSEKKSTAKKEKKNE